MLSTQCQHYIYTHHEVSWLKNCSSAFSPSLYMRYDDDIFVLMESEKDLFSFVEYMNTKHHMSFTYELEKENALSFLDIQLYRANDSFNTSIQ